MTNEPTTLATSVPQGKPDPASSIAAAETSARATPPIAVPRAKPTRASRVAGGETRARAEQPMAVHRATARYSKNPWRNARQRGRSLPAPVTSRFLRPLQGPPPCPAPPRQDKGRATARCCLPPAAILPRAQGRASEG